MALKQFQQQIFNDLEKLVAEGDAFYRQEFTLDGLRYWIYNYRLASYTEFLKPSAIECRGIMFEVDNADLPIRLASLPMSKFFNLNENPMTMNLDLSEIVGIEQKADGSLMSTYVHNGDIRLKSKGSLFSEQAIDAMEWLNLPEQVYLRNFLLTLHSYNGYTVNLEWCSARLDHRIVLAHQQSHLLVLNARHNETGKYMSREELTRYNDVTLRSYMIDLIDPSQLPYPLSTREFVERIPEMTNDIEGFVVELNSGVRFKVKTNKYLTAHRAKDSINSDRRLFETVIDEAVDDVRSLFAHDPLVLARIDAMQEKVGGLYNSMVKSVETFYENNSQLSRKEYAIKGQQELGMYFGLAMNKYVSKSVEYKAFIKARWKELGIKDAPAKQDVE